MLSTRSTLICTKGGGMGDIWIFSDSPASANSCIRCDQDAEERDIHKETYDKTAWSKYRVSANEKG